MTTQYWLHITGPTNQNRYIISQKLQYKFSFTKKQKTHNLAINNKLLSQSCQLFTNSSIRYLSKHTYPNMLILKKKKTTFHLNKELYLSKSLLIFHFLYKGDLPKELIMAVTGSHLTLKQFLIQPQCFAEITNRLYKRRQRKCRDLMQTFVLVDKAPTSHSGIHEYNP